MGFLLTEDQELIRKTARAFAQERLPIRQFRSLRDSQDETGFSRDAWRELAASGLAGVTIPESLGGAGLGFVELGLVLEELGRTLASTPMTSTVLLSANALLLGGTPEQQAALLPGIAAGERLVALAHDEGTRFQPTRVRTRATEVSSGFRLTGEKSLVLDAPVADELLVVARTAGEDDSAAGLTLFRVPRAAKGVEISRLAIVDSRNAGRVVLREVEVPRGAVLGEVGGAAGVLDRVYDRAAAALCAEMLGGALEVFERTVAYLKVRHQFGVPIGSFQALKHRAAWMFCELELSKSLVAAALRAIDDGSPEAPALASAAKARLTEVYLLVTAEGIQMHGGIGATDELDIGLFYKRARVAEMTFGGAAYHRDRFARLNGY